MHALPRSALMPCTSSRQISRAVSTHYRHRRFERARYGKKLPSGAIHRRHGFFEFRRQLEYKAAMRGGQVVVADRFYPSSKTCSCCGHRLEALPLILREWACPACATHHDRDVNAAVNLKNMAVSSTASACGEEGSGRARKRVVKPASVKQEASSRFSQI